MTARLRHVLLVRRAHGCGMLFQVAPGLVLRAVSRVRCQKQTKRRSQGRSHPHRAHEADAQASRRRRYRVEPSRVPA